MIKKHSKKIFLICLSLLIILLIFIFFRSGKAFYPDKQIQNISELYLSYFEKNALEVEQSLFKLKSDLDTVKLDSVPQKDFLNLLIKNLDNSKQIIAFLVLEHNNKMTMLEKDQATYLYTVDSSKVTDVVTWQRIDKEQNIINSWNRALGINLNVLDWGEEVFNDSYNYQVPIWTSVGRVIENPRKYIATHITWRSGLNNSMITCIAIVNEFNENALLPQSNGLNVQRFINNINDHVFPFFGKTTSDSLVSKLKNKSISSWKVTGQQENSTFNFSFNEDNYWGQSLSSRINGIKSLVLVVEENTLRFSLLADNFVLIMLGVVLLVLAVVFFILSRIRSSQSIEKYIQSQVSDKHASELIKLGENNQLEFKSSFRYDYNEEKVNKDLENVIAKSIAAFSNAKGGTLLIGVDDDGNILGLENDINTLKRKNIDFFENFLRTFLNKSFSISFVTNNLRLKFPVVDHKVICRIDVDPGQNPVFVELVKNNTKAERFYVRSGNTSVEMKTLSEINEYIQERF